ncbi:hypothetical protein ElyMa_002223800 [Elysia marginata]|uniref:Uncharacterized protein n=1 Tax=Elysia marginata TaxID=1093978 RepID=A0AAV4FVV7_9GAST|nr:hypothetical protein ElyMa_002223800 [Elysia marginata]
MPRLYDKHQAIHLYTRTGSNVPKNTQGETILTRGLDAFVLTREQGSKLKLSEHDLRARVSAIADQWAQTGCRRGMSGQRPPQAHGHG